LALLALVGCAATPVRELKLSELSVAEPKAVPALAEQAVLQTEGFYFFRALPGFGPLLGWAHGVHAVDHLGRAYSARDLATQWESLELPEAASDMRTAAFLSERLDPGLALAGTGLLGYLLMSYDPSDPSRGLWWQTAFGLVLAGTVGELTSHEYFASRAIARHNDWLAEKSGLSAAERPTWPGALWRSAILPGWGQVYKGDITQGLVVAALCFGSWDVYNEALPSHDDSAIRGRVPLMIAAYAFNLLDALCLPAGSRPYGYSSIAAAPLAQGGAAITLTRSF
jgi:hypothetical protein